MELSCRNNEISVATVLWTFVGNREGQKKTSLGETGGVKGNGYPNHLNPSYKKMVRE